MINAGLLILSGIVRIFAVKGYSSDPDYPTPFASFMLSFYVILFGVMILLVELSKLNARTWFYFLNFCWGRSLFSLFIFFFVLGSATAWRWLDIVLSLWSISLSIIFLVFHICHKDKEIEHIKKLMDEKAVKDKDLSLKSEANSSKTPMMDLKGRD